MAFSGRKTRLVFDRYNMSQRGSPQSAAQKLSDSWRESQAKRKRTGAGKFAHYTHSSPPRLRLLKDRFLLVLEVRVEPTCPMKGARDFEPKTTAT
jgi:hypothetical protein